MHKDFEAGSRELHLLFVGRVGIRAIGHANYLLPVNMPEVSLHSCNQILLRPALEGPGYVGSDVAISTAIGAAGVGVKSVFLRTGAERVSPRVEITNNVHEGTKLAFLFSFLRHS